MQSSDLSREGLVKKEQIKTDSLAHGNRNINKINK